MHYFILSLLLTVPASCTPTDYRPLTHSDELCAEIDEELRFAVNSQVMTTKEAAELSLRCWDATNSR